MNDQYRVVEIERQGRSPRFRVDVLYAHRKEWVEYIEPHTSFEELKVTARFMYQLDINPLEVILIPAGTKFPSIQER